MLASSNVAFRSGRGRGGEQARGVGRLSGRVLLADEAKQASVAFIEMNAGYASKRDKLVRSVDWILYIKRLFLYFHCGSPPSTS